MRQVTMAKEASRVYGTGLSSFDKHLYSAIVPASMQALLPSWLTTELRI